jgi:hypothetical protein
LLRRTGSNIGQRPCSFELTISIRQQAKK